MFIVLLVIPGTVISTFGYFNSKTGLEELTEKGLENSVQLANQLITSQNKLVEAGVLTQSEAEEEVKRQLIGEKTTDGKRKIDVQFEFGENGYFVVFDKEGNTIAHPSIEGKNVWDEQYNDIYFIQEMIKQAENGGGFTYYDFPVPDDPDTVKQKIAYSQAASYWGWIIGVNAYEHEYNNHTNSLIVNAIITLIITVIIGMFFGNFFANYISKPVNKIADYAKQIAHGNLALKELDIKNDDELGMLATHFNYMPNSLRKMIGHTFDTSHQVASTSEQLLAGSEQTNETIEQISSTIQEVVEDANQQLSHTHEVIGVIDEIVKTIENVTSEVEDVTSTSDDTITTATTGSKIVGEAGEQMKVIDQATGTLKNAIGGLEERSNQIDNIISLITNVSEQTNLLALNASIEAARAGEHGQGFAVVAEEIRALAEQSATATDDIRGLITEIKNSIASAVTAMDENEIAIRDGINLTNEADVAFQNISNEIHSVSGQIQQIAIHLQDTNKDTTRLIDTSEATAKITQSTFTYTEHVAAAIEEHTATMQEMTIATQELAKKAETLQSILEEFRL